MMEREVGDQNDGDERMKGKKEEEEEAILQAIERKRIRVCESGI